VGIRSSRNASCQICSALLMPLALFARLKKKAQSDSPVPHWPWLRSGSLRSPSRSQGQCGAPSRFALRHQQLHTKRHPCLCTKCYPCLCTQPTPALSPRERVKLSYASHFSH
jgi:hypothetical protein